MSKSGSVVVRDWSKEIDEAIGKQGLQRGMREYLHSQNVNVETILDEETKTVLTKKGALIIFTHPHRYDLPAIIAAIPLRVKNDVSLIASETVAHAGVHIALHIIPLVGDIKKNDTSIQDASNRMRKGEVVLIDLEAVNHNEQEWLVEINLLEKAGEHTQIVFAHAVNNIHDVDIHTPTHPLELIQPPTKLLLPRTVTVHFSRPLTSALFIKDDRKATMATLVQHYITWMETLGKKE